jgi:hypothetical protein
MPKSTSDCTPGCTKDKPLQGRSRSFAGRLLQRVLTVHHQTLALLHRHDLSNKLPPHSTRRLVFVQSFCLKAGISLSLCRYRASWFSLTCAAIQALLVLRTTPIVYRFAQLDHQLASLSTHSTIRNPRTRALHTGIDRIFLTLVYQYQKAQWRCKDNNCRS